MEEVSVDTGIKLFSRRCDDKGPPFSNLLGGVPYSESDLRFHKKRISWEEFLPFMKNVGQTWSTEQLEQIGRDNAHSHAARAAGLVGEHDKLTDSGKAKIIQLQIEHSTFITIPKAGHMSPVEEPERVTEIINDFLKKMPDDQSLQ